jgi:hypothetical protein
MVQLDREGEGFFTQPVRQIMLMLISLALVAGGVYLAYPQVAPVFLANLYLNGFIAFVFIIGVLACFWQVFQLVSSVGWIEGFAQQRPGHKIPRAPRLLAPLAALMRSRGARMQIGATSSRSILDSVATRIDEARDITRYIVSLLIFLGLLGTFYGLATTVPALVDTIRSLTPQEGETGLEVFNRLQSGLEAQLGGMGVAFASSLLGLAGSLVVGLLELFASHGQNRFYRELEEWLSSITRLGFSSGEGEGGGDVSGAAALVEHLAQQMETFQSLQEISEANRSALDVRLGDMVTAVETLAGQSAGGGAGNEELSKLVAGQEHLISLFETQMAAGEDAGGGGVDSESRMRLRSMDVQLLRILEEMATGRQETLTDLRADLSKLTAAVRELGR